MSLPGWHVKNPSRYRAVGTRDADGTFFHSKGELRRWQELQMLEKAGEIRDLQRQVRKPLYAWSVHGLHPVIAPVAEFTIDFSYIETSGEIVFEDFKSPATAKDEAYRLRKRWFEACYPYVVRETMRTRR